MPAIRAEIIAGSGFQKTVVFGANADILGGTVI